MTEFRRGKSRCVSRIRTVSSVLLIVVPPSVFGFLGQVQEMKLAVFMGIAAAVFVQLARFRSIKGGGFEAQLQDAEETLGEVKRIARPLLLAMLRSITAIGRWGSGVPIAEKISLFADLDDQIHGLGLDDQREFIAAKEEFVRQHRWDFYHKFVRCLSEDGDWPKATRDKLLRIAVDRSSRDFPDEARIRCILDEEPRVLTEVQEGALQDYLYFLNKGKLRRGSP